MPERKIRAPHFGIYHLSLDEAGLLIAKCLWFQGAIRADVPKKESYALHDPDLVKALRKPAHHYVDVLRKAVQTGSLKAAVIQQELNDEVEPAGTYLEALSMADWLEDRGLILGDAFEDEYLAEEAIVSLRAAETVAAERFRQQQKTTLLNDDTADDIEKLFLKHRVAELSAKLDDLESQPRTQAPITEKQRGAYLNIIGGLLGLLLGHSPSGQPYSKFASQQAVIDALHANFGEIPGYSQRNLVDKFALAKRLLKAEER